MHRAVVAEAAVADLVAEAPDLFARDRRRGVDEVDQQAQADIVAHRRALRRREQRPAGGGHRAHRTLLLAALQAALVAAPPAQAPRAFEPGGTRTRGRHAQTARGQRAAAVGQRMGIGQGLQALPVGPELGDLVEAGRRVACDGEAVEGLEDGVMLVAPAAQVDLAAVGLGELEGLAEEGSGHVGASGVCTACIERPSWADATPVPSPFFGTAARHGVERAAHRSPAAP